MSSKLNIFFTGATGYIGGTVLTRLLQHPDAASFQITALVRSAETGEKLKTLGVEVIIGSYTDENLGFLTEAASKADVVIAVARLLQANSINSINLAPINAILAGMKVKYEKSGKAPLLIHTSGSAFVMDDARGLHSGQAEISDLDVDKLNAIPVEVIPRNVDIAIIEADKAGYVKAYIIAPGAVFGLPSGPLVDLGIQKTSSALAIFIKPALVRRQGGYIGKGLNKWCAVDVEDTADLYCVIFDTIRSSSNSDAAGHGPEGYYFVGNAELSGLEIGRAISEALVDLGIGISREPMALSQEECEAFYPTPFQRMRLGANGVFKADRGRALGWNPKQGKAEFIASVKLEVEAFIATGGN
ncbi:hypothetical protein BDZ97DRAFT_1759854 [Flammula alnicola]|nr:hypothetical protein BDZ97DRAFT_1759854 [Flammula alnicola]